MMVTLPAVMLLSRLDYEDPTTLMLARAAYFTVAGVMWLLHKLAASKIRASGSGGAPGADPLDEEIYVPIAQVGMFGAAPVKEDGPRKKTTYRAHEEAECAQKAQQSMVTGLLMLFLTFKMGIHMPLLLQSVMGIMDLVTSPIIKKHVLGMEVDRPWKELKAGEPGAVDSSGAEAGDDATADAVASQAAGGAGAAGGGDLAAQVRAATEAAWYGQKPFTADVFEALHKKGADMNVQTKGDLWTPLMVAAGTRGVKPAVFHSLLKMGARIDVVDSDGWTALHWAAYHGNVDAVSGVLHGATPETEDMVLSMRSKGDAAQTPLEVAQEELGTAQQKLRDAETGAEEQSETDLAHLKSVIAHQEEVVALLEQRETDVKETLAALAGDDDDAEAESKGDEATGARRRKTAKATPAAAGGQEEDIEDID